MMNQFEAWKGTRDGQRITLLVIADRRDYDRTWGFYRLLATLERP